MKRLVLEVRDKGVVVDILPLKNLDSDKYREYKLKGYWIFGRTAEVLGD